MNTEKENNELLELRRKIFQIGVKGGQAHLASSYSCIEILYTLFVEKIINYDINNPNWEDRDRFILSKGHAGLALYSIFNKIGMLSDEDLESYLQDKSKIGGEPSKRDCDFVETATGSLGHGLAVAVGMALGLKINGSKSKVYCLVGDGELQEGVMWEAITFAKANKLDNLIIIVDNNGIQKMDKISNIIGNVDIKKIFEAYELDVKVVDGHSVSELKNVLMEKKIEGLAKVIIAKTIKGKGVSIMENNPIWHMKIPNKKEMKIFNEELKIEEQNK